MSDFVSDLWGSVFTPGTTPTLLLATNVTFALLQITLAGLLAATYSIHFVILSILSAGLWWAINWFAVELQAAQAKEEEAERIRKSRQRDSSGAVGAGDSADDEGTGTETEGTHLKTDSRESTVGGTSRDEQVKQELVESLERTGKATMGTGLAPPGEEARQRRSVADLSGDISTDSEWEKVEGER